MPKMSRIETAFCRSASWHHFTGSVVLPWALQGRGISGDVLELGAGSGAMAAALLQQTPGIRLTVTDLDEGMLAKARGRLPRPGPKVQQADATALPFQSASFDFVLSFLMLHHVLNWQAAIAEAARVLRPGGMLIGYDLTASPAAKLIHLVDRSPHRLVQPAELTATARLASLDISVRTGLMRQVMRFRARKS
ncbi:Methyltransferase domain-containing protein [Arthrobacter subterraneus]|uniref:Methyltransferase domain-containing protein n=1 Tax=Arthrobacter subterraneus TaxID=335973 RepID=A0A1G8CQI1_9MICC|nr:class I SAM-dependent methyltransferase [Arthrobacter subterraneus]SDH47449.1 Methyltransferase domain-containing protein [Arthrobacter subterraneus]